MKSLLISGLYFPPQVGGLSTFMSKLSEAMGRDRVCCLTGVSGKDVVDGPDSPNVYRAPGIVNHSGIRKALSSAAVLSRILMFERPQATILGTVDDGFLGLKLRDWFGLPFVVIAAGNEILDVIEERWPKPLQALQTADRVIAISRYTQSIVEQAGVDPERIQIVNPGYDEMRFRPVEANAELRKKLVGEGNRDQLIMTVGNLVARKGQDLTIRALPIVLERIPNVSYLIVGDGPYRHELEKIASDTGVRDRVIFAGRQTDADLASIYAVCDLFVMPSREQLEAKDVEGFGIVYLEAAACGKPAIGGRSGGVPDAIVDGVTGILVDPFDPADLANAIVELLTNRELARSMEHQARIRAERDFTWQATAQRIQGIMESLK